MSLSSMPLMASALAAIVCCSVSVCHATFTQNLQPRRDNKMARRKRKVHNNKVMLKDEEEHIRALDAIPAGIWEMQESADAWLEYRLQLEAMFEEWDIDYPGRYVSEEQRRDRALNGRKPGVPIPLGTWSGSDSLWDQPRPVENGGRGSMEVEREAFVRDRNKGEDDQVSKIMSERAPVRTADMRTGVKQGDEEDHRERTYETEVEENGANDSTSDMSSRKNVERAVRKGNRKPVAILLLRCK